MPVTPPKHKPLHRENHRSPSASGVECLLRWHLSGLGLLALAAVGSQAALHGPPGQTAATLGTLAILAGAAFVPGGVRRALDEQRALEARQADQDAALAEADKQVAEMRHVMANLSTLDTLTGLRSHRAFQEQLDIEMERSRRHGSPLSLLLLDVDRFQAFNDAFGHTRGDAALTKIAGLLKDNARTSDIPARFGGEEFAVLLTETDMMGSVVLGERLRQAVTGLDGLERPLTASLGIATLTPGIRDAAALIAEAGRALRAAKAEGRNRVSHAHRLPAAATEEKPAYARAA